MTSGIDATCRRDGQASNAGRYPHGRTWGQLVAAIISVLLLALAACDLGPAGANTGAAGFTPAAQTPHQDHRWVMYCPQEPGSQYPQADYTAANAYMASSLDAAVVPNADGM